MGSSYALATLWHDRNRFLPAVLAVAFSALLIALQVGTLLGTLAITSRPIDHASADLWIAIRDLPSIELSHPIPESWLLRLEALPQIGQVETYLYNFSEWHKPGGGSTTCCVIGSRLEPDALGILREISPTVRVRLTEPGAVVVDESDLPRLGLRHGIDEIAEIAGQRVRVVGLLRGFKGIWGPYVFCSQRTARMVLPMYKPEETEYVLARCKDPADQNSTVEQLRRQYPEMTVLTSEDFSQRTRWYWLTQTRVGIAMGLTSLLALLVGLVITSQTLYAATVAQLRELAVLRALGIPRWRMSSMVIVQAFWIGIAGVTFALPAVAGLARVADRLGAEVQMPTWLLSGTSAITLIMALLSGLFALGSLRRMEPATLLR